VERSNATGQESRPIGLNQPSQLNQSARPGANLAAAPSIVVRRSGAQHALSPVSEVDAREEAERRRQLVTLGLEVALAVLLTLAARIWGWAREERARARVNRELRRRIPAT
jgi:hypothetical protein